MNDKELLEKNFRDYKDRSKGGFAAFYCSKYKYNDEQMNVEIFENLVELDAKLGITATKQLLLCFGYTARLDIVKVLIIFVVY